MERLAPADRRLTWDACPNVRDLGGLSCGDSTLARARLVRASMLSELSADGRAAVLAHGIRTVIDLRTANELAEAPSPFRDGVTYRHAPFTAARAMGLDRTAADGRMSDELRRLAVPDGGLRLAMTAIAEAEPGILVHCLAGRDRTGFVVALTLAAIGVPDEEIVADYAASDGELADDYLGYRLRYPDQSAEMDTAIERRASTMQELLTTLRLAFGGAGDYLGIVGITPAQVDTIRMKLLA